MFLKIIKNEWQNLFAERGFLILAIAFAVLIFYGIYNSAAWIAERSAQSSALIAAQEKDLSEKREKTARGEKGSKDPANFKPDPADPYTIGMSLEYASLPFNPAAILSLGQADVLTLDSGVSVATLQRTKAEKTGFENPLSFLAGQFDLSFIIVYLLPLFVLALSFNVLSSEREQGILQLILSQPLQLKNLLTAKISAQFILIFALVTVASLSGIFLWAGNYSADFLSKILLWILLVAAYSAFWFALAAFINSFGFSSSANAVIAAACWLILVLILPSLLNIAVSAAYPVPSRNELISAVRGVNLDMRRDGSRLLAEHFQDHPELMPKDKKDAVNDFGLAFVHIQQEQKKRVDELETRFAEQLDNQQKLVKTLRFLSPSIIAQEASNDIAGTGLERYRRFRQQVKEFDQKRSDFFLPKIYRMENLTLEEFDRIPRFKYEEEDFSEIFCRVIFGILFLFATSGVLTLLTFSRLKNYRPER